MVLLTNTGVVPIIGRRSTDIGRARLPMPSVTPDSTVAACTQKSIRAEPAAADRAGRR